MKPAAAGKRANGLSPPHANGAGRGGGAVQSAANKGSCLFELQRLQRVGISLK